jgi:hypothetical protein
MAQGDWAQDDWSSFSMELWGIHITSWRPVSDRAGRLPEPLEYDVLQDGLIELGNGQRHTLLQGISCYQVRNPDIFEISCLDGV